MLERATQRERTYQHRWTVGDTVMWDNRGVCTARGPMHPNRSREMLRTIVPGNEPIQWPVRKQLGHQTQIS